MTAELRYSGYEDLFGDQNYRRISKTISFKTPQVEKTIIDWKLARNRKSFRERCTRWEYGGFFATNFGIISVSILWCYCIPPNLFSDGSAAEGHLWDDNIGRMIIFSVGLAISSINLLFLWLTHITDPGVIKPEPWFQNRELKEGERICTTCNVIRSPKAKHCSKCDHCVEHFDHHCPYAGVCVGSGNYLFFWLLLLCGIVSNIYSVIFCIWFLKDNWSNAWGRLKIQLIVGLLLTLLCTSIFVLIFHLAAYHCFISVKGQTTNERIKEKREKKKTKPSISINNVDTQPLLGGEKIGSAISLSVVETKQNPDSGMRCTDL